MPIDRRITTEMGLDGWPPFHRDLPFWIALLAGPVFWMLLSLFVPIRPLPPGKLISTPFLFLTLWQPTVEELLFRGFLQGQWSRSPWAKRSYGGITAANVVTSILFVLAHFFSHPPEWALSVLIPSLVFGYFRDRHQSIYPSIFLHIFYNAGYFYLTGLP